MDQKPPLNDEDYISLVKEAETKQRQAGIITAGEG